MPSRRMDERDARVLAFLRERGATTTTNVAKAIVLDRDATGAVLNRLRLRGLVFKAGTTTRGAQWGDGGPTTIWKAVPEAGE